MKSAFVLFVPLALSAAALAAPLEHDARGVVALQQRNVVASGVDIEPRQAAEIVEVAVAAVEAVVDIAKGIIDAINQDKEDRGKFTTSVVGGMYDKNPQFNYVICASKHDTKFDEKEGTDWSHTHQEFDIKFGGTVGFEIFAFKSGTFTLQGDGGYMNWAYIGNVKSDSGGRQPRTVVFNAA